MTDKYLRQLLALHKAAASAATDHLPLHIPLPAIVFWCQNE